MATRVATCTVRGWAAQEHARAHWLLPDNTVVDTPMTLRQKALRQYDQFKPDPNAQRIAGSAGPQWNRGAGGLGLAGDMAEHKATGWWWVCLTDDQRVDLRVLTTRAGRRIEVIRRGAMALLAPSQFTGIVPNITTIGPLPNYPGVSILNGVITIDDDLATEDTVIDRGEVTLHGSVTEEDTDLVNIGGVSQTTVVLTAAGANRCAVGLAGSIDPSDDDLSSANYDGVAMTEVETAGDTTESGNPLLTLVRLVAPNTTTNADLDFNWSGSMSDTSAFGAVLSSVDQTTPERDSGTASGTGTSSTVTLSGVVTGELLYDCYSLNGDPTPTLGDDQTSKSDQILAAGPITRGFHVTTQAGADGGTMSVSWSGSQTFFQCAIALRESAGAAPDITPAIRPGTWRRQLGNL